MWRMVVLATEYMRHWNGSSLFLKTPSRQVIYRHQKWHIKCFSNEMPSMYTMISFSKVMCLIWQMPYPEGLNSLWPSDAVWWQIWVNIGSGKWLVAWRNHAITWTNVGLSWVRSYDNHLGAISQEAHQPSVDDMSLKIAYLKFKSPWGK